MKLYGRAAVSEFLGDNVVYRNLTPIDGRLPSLGGIRAEIGLAEGITPRKTSMEYAQVMARILMEARQIDSPGNQIKRVIFVGDTRLNDSTAFANICRAGNWPGWAFIGAENDDLEKMDLETLDIGGVMAANRWTALGKFQGLLIEKDFPIDENTAILLDLDKTTLGARGRNDKVIDQVRVEAATHTVRDALGDEFDPDEFKMTYDYFNQVKYHPFTTDNQDYLVYICLVIGAGLFSRDGLRCAIENNVIVDFDSLLLQVEHRSVELASEIREIHRDVYQRVQSGDPTPFKAFRRAEFLATAARMGKKGSGISVNELLSQEIVITHEVRELMLHFREQGALLFGLSDKPDEASIPTPEMESQGFQPIHRIETSVVGE